MCVCGGGGGGGPVYYQARHGLKFTKGVTNRVDSDLMFHFAISGLDLHSLFRDLCPNA